MSPKIIRGLWILSILFNLVLFIDWINVKKTGFFVFSYTTRHQWAIIFIDITVFCTIIAIVVSLYRSLLSLRRTRIIKNKIVSSFLLITLLLYLWHGFSFCLHSHFNFMKPQNVTLYSSPSNHKQILFYKDCYFHCLNKAYEVRGIFQRRTYSNQILHPKPGLNYEIPNKGLIDAFQDPSKVKLIWNKDETVVNWVVEVGNEEIKGIVYFY